MKSNIPSSADGAEVLFYQSILDAIPNAICYKDLEGRYLGCNAAFEKLLGVTREAVRGKTAADIAPELAEISVREESRLLRTGEPCRYEGEVLLPDGRSMQAIFCKAPLIREGKTLGIVAIVHDVSDLRQARQEVQDAWTFWKLVLDHMRDAVSIIDAGTLTLVGANRVYRETFGDGGELLGRRCHDLLFSGDHEALGDGQKCPLHETVVLGKPVTFEHQLPVRPGRPQWVEVSTAPIKSEEGELKQIVLVSRDITERKQQEERIQKLAYFDALTGLPNRTLLLDRLGQLTWQSRHGGASLAVIWMDVDHFKRINDSLGYASGDKILVALARRLKNLVRQSDTLARVGSDEFVLLLSAARNARDAAMAIRSLQRATAEPFLIDGQELRLALCFGVSLMPEDGDSGAELMKNAEMACREAKMQGRGGYLFFSEELNRTAHQRLKTEIDLHRALREDELILHYQPQVGMPSGEWIGVEALVRWQHPQQGLISPGRFIPLAEESGLILGIGEWVLRSACRQAAAWSSDRSGLRVAVNLSSRQLQAGDLVPLVKRTLEETGLDPTRLELELTETLLLENSDPIRRTLRQLKDLGVSLAIDDFGTGYSSLSYLQRFPLDRLKVAQNFTRNLPDRNHLAIVRAIVAMARALDLEVIVEGVETRVQRDLIAALECHAIQGFYYARPMPPQEMEAYRAARREEVGFA